MPKKEGHDAYLHNTDSKKLNKINQKITLALIKDAILSEDDDIALYIMTKEEQIIQKHITQVDSIHEKEEEDGRILYWTKLNPKDRNHSSKKTSHDPEKLRAIIISHYLGLEEKKITVSEALRRATEECIKDTKDIHRQRLVKYFSSISSKNVGALTEDNIRNCLQSMINTGITQKAFTGGISTLNKIYDYCSYNHIEIIDIRSIVRDFRRVKCTSKKTFIEEFKSPYDVAFTEEETIILLTYIIENPEDVNLCIGLLLTTGIRLGEALALTVNDVDLKTKTLSITKKEHNKAPYTIESVKDYSDRIVCLSDDAMAIIQLILKDKTDVLFTYPGQDKLHAGNVDKRIRRIQKKDLDLPHKAIRSAHDCRRTYASIAYLHDIDIKTIKNQCGHKDEATTWIYIKDIIELHERQEIINKASILGVSSLLNATERKEESPQTQSLQAFPASE
ncbi:MAG: tyrosine-type recombinase/integrase [Lachnospiraceae bacterium]|nr:tyrosine-type recombinase/integrase [Lachnospiraceae bacterium]